MNKRKTEKTASHFHVDILSLKEGETPFQLVEDMDLLGLPQDLAGQGTVEVKGSITKLGQQLLVKAAISHEMAILCSRCLEPLHLPLRTSIETICVLGEGGPGSQNEDEIMVLPNDEQSIDLTEMVREAILLAMPLKPLCREECRGWCPRCGKNLNNESCQCSAGRIDSRWTALEVLRQSEADQTSAKKHRERRR